VAIEVKRTVGVDICKEASCITRVEVTAGYVGLAERWKKKYCPYVLKKRSLWMGSGNNTAANNVKRTVGIDICKEAS
jgi:hypothetical protein